MMRKRKLIGGLAIWYLILNNPFNTMAPTQVGPFATQAACQNVATQAANMMAGGNPANLPPGYVAGVCFSTTAKS